MIALLLTALGSTPSIAVVARVAPASTATVAAVDIEAMGIAAARWFTDVEVLTEETTRGGLDQSLRGCGPDNRCVAAKLEQAGVDQVLYLIANVSVTPTLVSAEIVDERGRVVAAALEPVTATLPKAVASAARAALLSADHTLGARLSIEVHPLEASLRIEPDRPIERGVAHYLAPGRYAIVADAPGHESQKKEIELASGGDVTLELTLEESTVLESWWLWTLVGVGVAGIASGVTVALWPRKEIFCQSCSE